MQKPDNSTIPEIITSEMSTSSSENITEKTVGSNKEAETRIISEDVGHHDDNHDILKALKLSNPSPDVCRCCLPSDNGPGSCHAQTFLDIVSKPYCNACRTDKPVAACNGGIEVPLDKESKKIVCVPRNETDVVPKVMIFNSSELLVHLGPRNSTSSRCTVVLFFAPWCTFSARLAPHYNALARAFSNLDIVAIDAFHFSKLVSLLNCVYF